MMLWPPSRNLGHRASSEQDPHLGMLARTLAHFAPLQAFGGAIETPSVLYICSLH